MQISRRRALGLPALAALTSPIACAKDHFWDSKPAAEWTEKEVREVMVHSPWAKEVTAEFKGGGVNMRPPGGGGGGGGRGGMGGGPSGGGGMDASGGGPPMGGGNRGFGGGGPDMPPRMPEVKALVRWETASPVREAGKRNWPPSAASTYIVTVSGLPNMGGGAFGGGGGMRGGPGGAGGEGKQPPPPPMDPEQRRKMMAERLKAVTRLERKGKDPIAPDQVQLGQTPAGASILMFVFPKTGQPIELADKEVVFITQMGPMEVKAKFALKDMTVKGQLEL